jgi:hypothetical protein
MTVTGSSGSCWTCRSVILRAVVAATRPLQLPGALAELRWQCQGVTAAGSAGRSCSILALQLPEELVDRRRSLYCTTVLDSATQESTRPWKIEIDLGPTIQG